MVYRLCPLSFQKPEPSIDVPSRSVVIDYEEQYYFSTHQECLGMISKLKVESDKVCFVIDKIPIGVPLGKTHIDRYALFRDEVEHILPDLHFIDEKDIEEYRALERIRLTIAGCGSWPAQSKNDSAPHYIKRI